MSRSCGRPATNNTHKYKSCVRCVVCACDCVWLRVTACVCVYVVVRSTPATTTSKKIVVTTAVYLCVRALCVYVLCACMCQCCRPMNTSNKNQQNTYKIRLSHMCLSACVCDLGCSSHLFWTPVYGRIRSAGTGYSHLHKLTQTAVVFFLAYFFYLRCLPQCTK